MKKVKEKKPVDYSKVPDVIWQKEWDELMESMKQIETDLAWMSRMTNYIEGQYAKQKQA